MQGGRESTVVHIMDDNEKGGKRRLLMPRNILSALAATTLLIFGLSYYPYKFHGTTTSSPSTYMSLSLSSQQRDVRQETIEMSSLRRRQALMAPVVFPQLYPECGRIKHLPPMGSNDVRGMSKSQCKEDVILYEEVFSKDNEPGVFLEIGALDGHRFSNTFLYEHGLGWRGILVEPHPINAMNVRRAHRPRSASFTMAVCNIPNDEEPGSLAFSTAGSEVATALDHAAPGFLKNWAEKLGRGNVSVPCIPLQHMIEVTGLLDIDFFSLDVEGGEMAVLETVDLDVVNVRLLMVELDGWNKEKDERVRSHLLANGFISVSLKFLPKCTKNEVFVNPKFAERKAARKPLPIQC